MRTQILGKTANNMKGIFHLKNVLGKSDAIF